MDTVRRLEQQRRAVLEQMEAIRSMRRGTVNEQYVKVPHKGRTEPILRGPYYVLTTKRGGRTVSQRLTGPEQVAAARSDVAAYKRFVELCRRYEDLTEALGQLERGPGVGQKKERRR